MGAYKVQFVTVCQEQIVSAAFGFPASISGGMGLTGKQIGANVRRRREQLGLTRPELAERLGVDVQTVQKVESGDRVKQWHRVADFAAALGSSPNELLGFPIASPDALGMALRPILAAFGAAPDDADSIARILLEAVEAAQSSPGDAPEEVRFRVAGQILAAQSRAQKTS